MNEAEQKLADYLLKQGLSAGRFASLYLDLMRAVKIRLECEKIIADRNK
jgi:hypothetical protein